MPTQPSTTTAQAEVRLLESQTRRLRLLFDRYKRLYWHEKLAGYRIRPTKLDGLFGRCDGSKRIIDIDVQAHARDRDLRSTVLHEMCHAAAYTQGSRGHDVKFFAQLSAFAAG